MLIKPDFTIPDWRAVRIRVLPPLGRVNVPCTPVVLAREDVARLSELFLDLFLARPELDRAQV